MKLHFPFIILGFSSMVMFSCNNKETQNTTEEVSVFNTDTKPKAKTGDQSLEGYSLITQTSDCLSCHKENERLIGPSYAEVAEKYTEADIEQLADKIIEGGSGVWGDAVMTPHPALSKEDAKKMVVYILSIK